MKKLILMFVMVCALGMAQDNTRKIQGKVTYLDTPLVNAKISVASSGEEQSTDAKGFYTITAAPGEVIAYSYSGMRTTEIVVEDVTRILNIELMPEVNQLDEVVVEKTVIKSQKQMREEYAYNPNIIHTAFGYVNKETTNFRMSIVEGKNLNPIGLDIATALQFRVPNMRVNRSGENPLRPEVFLRGSAGVFGFAPVVFDVDGLIMTTFPDFLMVENIERVAVITGLGAVNRYGFVGNGGVIVINTKGANYGGSSAQAPPDLARLKNNVYKGDALSAGDLNGDKPSYLILFGNAQTELEAKEIHEEQIKKYRNSFHYVLDAYGHFAARWKDRDLADAIVADNWELFGNNPVALKALAYLYQAEGRVAEANKLYKEIFILRPNYAQSYMDMANSYREVGDYQKAAGIYARYGYLLEQGFLRAEGDLGTIMERDLNNLVALKGEGFLDRSEQKRLVLDDEFQGTRIVFEWNDGEAEFELQFVNPEGNYFKTERSLFADADKVRDAKISGFSSEEYLIDDAIRGTWQVNAKYLGNKSLTPTYLKATVYHNYGSASQRMETKVFKLDLRNVNLQLFTVSNTTSVVSN